MQSYIVRVLRGAGLVIVISLIAAGCIKQGSPEAELKERPANTQEEMPHAPAIMYKGVEGKNALELLKVDHQVLTKTFPGAGEFVESIDGVKPNEKQFWAFYINGASSNVGAGQYQTKPTDVIEWKLEDIK